MSKHRLIIDLVAFAVVLLVGAIYLQNKKVQQECATGQRYAPQVGDTFINYGDPQTLVGWSQSIFAGKVLQKVKDVPNSLGLPDTLYDVKVIYNLKGAAPSNIDVNSAGWLEVGSTYLFATRHIPETGDQGYYAAPYPPFTTMICGNPNVPDNQLYTLVEQNGRTYELLSAYPSESLFGNDVQHGYIDNNYQSLSWWGKFSVYAELVRLKLSAVYPVGFF